MSAHRCYGSSMLSSCYQLNCSHLTDRIHRKTKTDSSLLVGTIIMQLFSAIAVILLGVTKTEVSTAVSVSVEAVEILVMLGSIVLVEMKLKRSFDEHGKRR